MKKIIFPLLLFIIASSCIKIFDDSPYYKINKSDNNYLPTAYKEKNKIRNYKSQDGKIIKIKNKIYSTIKNSDSAGWLQFDTFYYFDELRVILELMDFENREIGISVCKISTGELIHRISLPSKEGPPYPMSFKFKTPDEYTYTTMNINNKTYNKVRIFEREDSANPIFLYENSTINKVYYDINQGFIGFDDTKNNIQFRLIN